MAYYRQLENGIRLVVKEISGISSVSIGILVHTGAAIEKDNENGISHYIEHMMFKGTERYSAFALSDEMDKIGAQSNAFTGKDMTCYYVKSTSEHAGRAFELLADMLLHSTFPGSEMEREKGVIHEEISMTEDTPDDLCMDLLSEAFYGKYGYGRNILGTHESLSAFTRGDIISYLNKFYTTDNIVICMAGNIEESYALGLATKYFGDLPATKAEKREIEVKLACGSILRYKEIEQVHIGLSYLSLPRCDKLFEATQILNSVLGGGMSSRLFQTVREKMGLAYTVYSCLSPFADTGSMIIYAGVNAATYKRSLDIIYKCIEDIKKKDITNDEFLRGKEQLLSATVFSQESTSSQMLSYGKELMYFGKVYDLEDKLKAIKDVTLDDVYAATEINLCNGKAAAIVGAVDKQIEL